MLVYINIFHIQYYCIYRSLFGRKQRIFCNASAMQSVLFVRRQWLYTAMLSIKISDDDDDVDDDHFSTMLFFTPYLWCFVLQIALEKTAR